MPNSNVVDLVPDLSTEQVPRDDPRSEVVSIDPERHSGDPCFVGTRVPLGHLWGLLSAGGDLDEFLESFPTVKRSQALEVIRLASERLLDGLVAK
jgi:uncharacterized protein (DUF433 family)